MLELLVVSVEHNDKIVQFALEDRGFLDVETGFSIWKNVPSPMAYATAYMVTLMSDVDDPEFTVKCTYGNLSNR